MTGTAETEAREFCEIYKLDVVGDPDATSRCGARTTTTSSSSTKREKYNAIIEEIVELHERGQPVLVGTMSVEVSETAVAACSSGAAIRTRC